MGWVGNIVEKTAGQMENSSLKEMHEQRRETMEAWRKASTSELHYMMLVSSLQKMEKAIKNGMERFKRNNQWK